MFTGLVADVGEISAAERTADGVRLTVRTALADEIELGDSVSVDGVCLTAVARGGGAFAAEVVNETLRISALSELGTGAAVNLELALRAADRLGGHIVQGHVDGVGTIGVLREDGFSQRMTIAAPPAVLRFCVPKGSIAVSGVSLTIAALEDGSFTVALIPETRQRTTLGQLAAGDTVNLEVDVLAKYVERLIAR
jgi:riboflavin synthase